MSKAFKYHSILTAQALLMLSFSIGPYIDHQGYDLSLVPFEWHKTIGFILNMTGFVFAAAAIFVMKRSFTPTVKPMENGGLVTSGPFKYCRNPIYFALLLVGLGTSTAFLSLWSLVSTVFLFLVLLVKINFEQQELIIMFGQSYLDYSKKTKKIIPFLI